MLSGFEIFKFFASGHLKLVKFESLTNCVLFVKAKLSQEQNNWSGKSHESFVAVAIVLAIVLGHPSNKGASS